MFMTNASSLSADEALNFAGPGHAVQFYDSDDFLAGVVSEYVARGLAAGEPAVIIATDAHRRAFSEGLANRGIDVDAARAAGELTLLDARETLAHFMIDSSPDRDRFMTTIGGVLEKVSGGDNRVRAYGEMVDLLWRDGNPEGAITLEEHWNDLGSLFTFSLLCAYPMGNFSSEAQAVDFDRVCKAHGHVIPADSLVHAVDDGAPESLAREVAMLQQRARSLATEIEHRKELEKALRSSLSAQERAERELTRANEEKAFLLEATNALNRSLDYDARLRETTQLPVPRLADWCAVDIARDNGSLERKSASYVDGLIDDTIRDMHPRLVEVLRSGRPETIDAGPHHVLLVPLQAGDRPFGVLTLVRAVWARPYPESEVALAAELARRAAMAIENARLYRLAQDANRIKDQFLATLSHELRTPLTAILGWARMLTVGGLDADTIRAACSTIERAARTQASLIDDLLDLSKVVTGKLTLKTEPVDLASVLDGALETLRLAADTKGIRVEIAPARGRSIVTGDSTRLQQIVWNLVSNALKFSERGSGVFIALEQSGGAARIVVRDEGRGIAPEFLPHVFDAFRQADGATTREHGGLGLGLAIVKYLTELHGGSVAATSAGIGEGSTFTVILPLALQRTMKSEPAAPNAIIDLTGTSVLVVDDDADTRELVSVILRRSGASVMATESADEAAAAIRARKFSVVVTDIAMPERDGFAFVRSLRANADTRRLPVVALTASADTESEQRVNASGFNAFVRKPIDPAQFVRVIAATAAN
jgi:signal transduction histidine kinase